MSSKLQCDKFSADVDDLTKKMCGEGRNYTRLHTIFILAFLSPSLSPVFTVSVLYDYFYLVCQTQRL